MNPKIIIRQETVLDHPIVHTIIQKAFEHVPYSDQSEPQLVQRLRTSSAFIPQLSLVALLDDQIVGHILLTSVQIISQNKTHHALALAPVSVLPDFQSQGIGRQLILKAHQIAETMDHVAIVLLGHADYYPRFGYSPAHQFGIKFPFEAPPENCMVKPLKSLKDISGMIKYPPAFFE